MSAMHKKQMAAKDKEMQDLMMQFNKAKGLELEMKNKME